MKNFGRVVCLALRYRVSLVLSIACALAVGLLWGGNLGAVYPFVQMASNSEASLSEVIDAKIADKIAATEEESAKWEAETERLGLVTKVRLWANQKTIVFCGYLRSAVARFLPKDPMQTVIALVVLVLLGTVLKCLFVIAHTILVGQLSHLAAYDLRVLFYRRTLPLDLATFSSEGTADLMSRFTHDMNAVATGLTVLFGKLVREPLKMAVCLIGAAWVSWRLLLLSLVVVPIAGLAIRWLARTLKRANRRAMEEMAQLYGTLDETLHGIKIVKAFTMERQERNRFRDNSKKYYKSAMRIVRYNSLSHPITEVLGLIIICLAITAGAYLVISEETSIFGVRMASQAMDLPKLLLFYALLIGAADPARKLAEVFSKLQTAAAAADRIYAMVDREPSVQDIEAPIALECHQKSLVFDHVDFEYTPGRPVLREIDLEIRFGETIAIVGPNGCGKSTLADLIPRFADPTAGEIRIDDIPLTDVRLRDLRSQIGLVSQDSVLFDDTVMNNIRYGSPNASDEEVLEAARQAHAHRFIEEELPNGYDSVVGPMGGQLSGGQRQRIALARAILRNPPILLLDEATSQVDLQSEQLIQKVLERFIRDRTTIIITHRLGALALADRIVVIEDGRITAVGRHEELVATCEFYAKLHQINFEDRREIA